MAHVIEFRLGKNAFRFLQIELMGGEGRKNRVQMRDMGMKVTAIDEDIVKKYCNKFSEKRPESVVHGGLEGGGRIAEAEGHYAELVMTLVRAKSGLGNI